MDDYALTTVSESLQDDNATLRLGLESVANSLVQIGMICDESKLDAQHCTRRSSNEDSPFSVVNVCGRWITITAPKSVRWPGIHFDRQFSFQDHVKIAVVRVTAVVDGLRFLGNTVRASPSPT